MAAIEAEKNKGVGQFTFIAIDVHNPNLEFEVPKGIWTKKVLPNIIWGNGELHPHPERVEEILASINK